MTVIYDWFYQWHDTLKENAEQATLLPGPELFFTLSFWSNSFTKLISMLFTYVHEYAEACAGELGAVWSVINVSC